MPGGVILETELETAERELLDGEVTTDELEREVEVTTDELEREADVTTDELEREADVTTDELEREVVTEELERLLTGTTEALVPTLEEPPQLVRP